MAAPVVPGRRHVAIVFADGGDSASILTDADVLAVIDPDLKALKKHTREAAKK